MIDTPRLYRALTHALPLAGHRDMRQRPSTAELALEAEFAEALEEPVGTNYRYPLRNGVTAVPEDDGDVLPWLLAAVGTAAATSSLRSTLRTYLRQAFNVGGAVALAEMGVDEQFSVQDAALVASINAWAASLVVTGSDISLTRTTANDLAAQILAGREMGLTAEELEDALTAYIAARSLTRAGSIAFNETIRLSRRGEVATYGRNAVRRVIYRMSRGRNALRPDVCDDDEGREFDVGEANFIPQHVGCACYWQPVLSGWVRPSEVWSGG